MTERQLSELIGKLKVLKVEEASILAQIEVLSITSASPRATVATSVAQRVNGIAKGDRIRIKNRVRKPATWTNDTEWTEAKERLATVTRVSQGQIHFITDNGTLTWRAPNNVRRLDNDEH